MDASEKNYVEKNLLKMFLTVLTLTRHQCEIFNFVLWWGVYWAVDRNPNASQSCHWCLFPH